MPAPKFRVDAGFDVAKVAAVLDFINVMTYDMHGPWDKFADHHAPLNKREHDYYPYNTLNVAFAMRYWAEKGAPRSKLIMGVPFYGRAFELINPANTNPGPNAKAASKTKFAGPFTEEGGLLAYYEICDLVKGWTAKTDSDGNVYVHEGEKWIGYDTPQSVERKVRINVSDCKWILG